MAATFFFHPFTAVLPARKALCARLYWALLAGLDLYKTNGRTVQKGHHVGPQNGKFLCWLIILDPWERTGNRCTLLHLPPLVGVAISKKHLAIPGHASCLGKLGQFGRLHKQKDPRPKASTCSNTWTAKAMYSTLFIIPSLRWPKSRERSMGETQGLTSVREMPQYSLQSPRLSARPQWPWEAHPSTGSPGHWTEEVVLVCSVNLSRCSSWNSEWSNDKGLTHLSSFSVSTCYLDLYIWWYHLQVPNQGVKYCEDSKAPASAVQILLQRSWSCATSNSKSLFFQSICPSWDAPW